MIEEGGQQRNQNKELFQNFNLFKPDYNKVKLNMKSQLKRTFAFSEILNYFNSLKAIVQI
jgi:hypothetical protein